MPLEFKIFMTITIVIIIAIPLVFFLAFWLPNYRSVMRRARKIDPSVKTFAEATYVLQKDVMKSVGQKNATEHSENAESNEETK